MKKCLIVLSFFLSALFVQSVYAQSDVSDKNYGFKISLGSSWTKSKTEETSNKDAISYTFDKKDGKDAIMLLAFKVENVKSLEDMIYTLEKDVTLNIPKKSGDYSSVNNGDLEGKVALYKDSEFAEKIYFYRTKFVDGKQNYTYMLRFITSVPNYNTTTESEFTRIADTFRLN